MTIKKIYKFIFIRGNVSSCKIFYIKFNKYFDYIFWDKDGLLLLHSVLGNSRNVIMKKGSEAPI